MDNQITIRISDLAAIRGDVNKKVAEYLKARGINVLAADVIVLADNEPGRCWVKKPGQSACTAYG